MRSLGEIPHPAVKISLFHWNGKFLVKFERGFCEQTFKFEQLELDGGEKELREKINAAFIERVVKEFEPMHELRESVLRGLS